MLYYSCSCSLCPPDALSELRHLSAWCTDYFKVIGRKTGDEGSLVHMSSWRFAAQTNDKDDVTVIYFDGMSDS